MKYLLLLAILHGLSWGNANPCDIYDKHVNESIEGIKISLNDGDLHGFKKSCISFQIFSKTRLIKCGQKEKFKILRNEVLEVCKQIKEAK